MKNSILSFLLVAAIVVNGCSLKGQTAGQAMASEQQGNLEQAAQAWKTVTERNPRDAEAFARLGIVLSRRSLKLLVLLLAGSVVNGQTSAQSDRPFMRQHYDAAYRLQASGDFTRADVEHIRFVTEALNRLANFHANTGDYLHANPIYIGSDYCTNGRSVIFGRTCRLSAKRAR